ADWLPYLAQVAGAKPPLRVPAWLGRLLAGEFVVAQMTSSRGSSNQKARKELGWVPRYASWREGFRARVSRWDPGGAPPAARPPPAAGSNRSLAGGRGDHAPARSGTNASTDRSLARHGRIDLAAPPLAPPSCPARSPSSNEATATGRPDHRCPARPSCRLL